MGWRNSFYFYVLRRNSAQHTNEMEGWEWDPNCWRTAVHRLQCKSGSSIIEQWGSSSESGILMTKMFTFTAEKNPVVLIRNCFFLSLGLHEGRLSDRETYNHQKRTTQHDKVLEGQVCPLGSESGSSLQKTMRIRIHNIANITLIAEHIEPRYLIGPITFGTSCCYGFSFACKHSLLLLEQQIYG